MRVLLIVGSDFFDNVTVLFFPFGSNVLGHRPSGSWELRPGQATRDRLGVLKDRVVKAAKS